ncbi:hypothetical protein DMN91_007707 [Ooceraea biroi]|uniref:Uncharacterized protein n=1 Tax=Ooceraea biroi TaxID=2015173 RepID=A0A026W138_OOCBI|nr:uncharacterized protein LOC105284375 [Ooceraea biroi]EZA49728.1 hypothetical protein X777_11600 [Ooceraea biroi]RLU21091.1 hypothetical protein DMN91_007707 [Ooceraea biroi]
MPQIMAEAFARGLLDKIMIEVLDVIDRNAQNEKSWGYHEETGDARSEYLCDESQVHERTRTNYSKAEEMELIAKIVNGLRDIQIGDSRYVLPPSLLEKQVKCATCTVDTSPANPATDVTEAQRTTQGQGDIHQIVHAAVLESPTEPTELSELNRKEKEAETREATTVSVGLLHQLIEELETKAVPTSSKNDALLDSTSKERFLVWEEKEEQLIRTIEGNVGDTQEITTKTPRESEFATSRFRIVKVNHEDELEPRSSQHVTSALGEVDLEEIHIEERDSNPTSSSKLPCDDATMERILPVDAKKRKAFGDAKTKTRKKGLGSRLRRFFRVAFGRREN